MSDSKTLRNQLRIKTGVVNRLGKEHALYMKEAEENTRKVDTLVSSGTADEWDVKAAKRLQDESGRMIVDVRERLEKAADDLRDLVASTVGEPGVGESEEWANADKALELLAA
ncbi:tubulin binding cofactor A [Dacryopinax primogenitus]|uniref:Tubulin-specific chaperone A n=1 Tax=Dacryopinax primogenitus (strain DJM 731) TaxID=1858805 RepID=M5GB35_DACPD|nr:tubulin binding cofactor A [Dacryopinax primogenitus]EJU06139.1 tubulin binding cofactor A [Dacryopinax primogenitus]